MSPVPVLPRALAKSTSDKHVSEQLSQRKGIQVQRAAHMSARAGHCGVTPDESLGATIDPNCCGSSGAFTLPHSVLARQHEAHQWCVRKCHGCASCRFVSVSRKFRDCSWYASCNLDALTKLADFETTAVVPPEEGERDVMRKRCDAVQRADLSPELCRGPKGDRGGGKLDPGMCRSYVATMPPDRHARQERAALGPLYTISDVARLLSGKRLALLGDSVMDQMFSAFVCALQSTGMRVEQVRRLVTVPELAAKCQGLWIATARGLNATAFSPGRRPGQQQLNGCNCRVKESDSWMYSPCALLSATSPTSIRGEASLASLAANRSSFLMEGWHVPSSNFTLHTLLPMGRFASTEACVVCERRCRTHFSRWNFEADHCESHGHIPSTVSLLHSADAADVILLNFGHHYHNASYDRWGTNYHRALRAALEELSIFAQKGGRAVAFRETSWQHFGMGQGDFDELALDHTRYVKQSGAWSGPSLCTPAPEGAQHTWKNLALRAIMRENPKWAKQVTIMPFEARTRLRWDMHGATRVRREGGRLQHVTADCTHFCYSPRFWDLVFHDLYETLRKSSPWLMRRHRKLTTRSPDSR